MNTNRATRLEGLTRIGLPMQIREMRKKRGWNQAELARRAGTSQDHISKLENPQQNSVKVRTLVRLAMAFDCGLTIRFEGE